MKVDRIFVNTHKYDFHLAKVCIASIRYWYPFIPIYLLKELNSGEFDTGLLERMWQVKVLDISRKRFGWGYGKLEPLFLNDDFSFLVVDADTVFTGPVIDMVTEINTQFVVDKETQTSERFNQIYYSLDKIRSIEQEFVYPGYSFNTGQWFGTTNILKREDFKKCLEWSEPPKPLYPTVLFNGDQGIMNFVFQWLEQKEYISIAKIKLMVWPDSGAADFIKLEDIKNKIGKYPYIIHWAGMNLNDLHKIPRADIHAFYREYYYTKVGAIRSLLDKLEQIHLRFEKKIKRIKQRLV